MFAITIYINTKSTQDNLSRSQKDQEHFDEDRALGKIREQTDVLKTV